MLQKYKLPAAIVLAGTIAVTVLVVAKPTPEPTPVDNEPVPVKVGVTRAEKRATRLAVRAQGTVLPRREIDLIAQVSGQIVSVEPAFVDGGFIDRGQTLIRIDDRDYEIALLNARARLAEAAQGLAEEEGRSRVAAREWRDLGNDKANQLFMRKPQLAAARANHAAAEGDVAMAELNLERTKIPAPFEGRIKQTYADLGQFVTAGTRVATVYDSTVVEVRLPLTESQAALIDLPLTEDRQEQAGEANPPPPVTIHGSVAGTRHQWSGVLARTDAFIDADSRMYYAVVEVHDPFDSTERAPLLPGLFVEAEIAGKQMDGVMELPRSALFRRDKIAVLDENNAIGYQSVEVLQRSDSKVWVRSTLPDKTLVALEKQSLTPEGSIVEPVLSAAGHPEVAETSVATAAKE